MIGVDYASVDQNAPPDYYAARAWGLKFSYIRGSIGRNPDPTLARDRDRARSGGLPVGAFMAVDWADDPEPQARALIASCGTLTSGYMPPAVDIEFSRGIASTGLTPRSAIEKIERIIATLQERYPTIVLYTSLRVWTEDLGDLVSKPIGACPLWIKDPYPWNPRNPPHLESIPPVGHLPTPWQDPTSPGAWIQQFQGDAIKVPGFSSTVDLNNFLVFSASREDPRKTWIDAKLTTSGFPPAVGPLEARIRALQTAHQIPIDGLVGLETWALLCTT